MLEEAWRICCEVLSGLDGMRSVQVRVVLSQFVDAIVASDLAQTSRLRDVLTQEGIDHKLRIRLSDALDGISAQELSELQGRLSKAPCADSACTA